MRRSVWKGFCMESLAARGAEVGDFVLFDHAGDAEDFHLLHRRVHADFSGKLPGR